MSATWTHTGFTNKRRNHGEGTRQGKGRWRRKGGRRTDGTSSVRGEPGPVDMGRDEKKRKLMQMVGNTSRGTKTTNETKIDILQALEIMERDNPTEKPARNPMLSGKWALLYYAAADAQAQAKAGEVEGPFLSFFKPLLGGLFRTKSNSQNIDVEGGKVENIAEFATAFGLQGMLNIQGNLRVVSDERAEVAFERFVLRLGKLSVTVPLSWVNARGYVDTTYLDDTIRIGRGDKGSIFLNARRQD